MRTKFQKLKKNHRGWNLKTSLKPNDPDKHSKSGQILKSLQPTKPWI